MTNTEMKNIILDYLRKNKGTSYVEIERIFKENNFDYQGERSIISSGCPNVIFWSGWNENAIGIVRELSSSGEIEREPCDPIMYLIDGGSLDLPIQRTDKELKTPHWLPILFKIKN